MSPALLGFVRGLGTVILTVVLAYVGDVNHLDGILSASGAALISALALALEHAIEQKTGRAVFGAVKRHY